MLAVTLLTSLTNPLKRAVLLSLLVCLPVAATCAEPERPVYLKAQPLQQALQSLATTFNRAFIINAKRIDHLAAARLDGRYTLENALAQLLMNTGLTYQINDDGIVIKAEQPHQQQRVMEEVAVNGIRASLNRSRQQKRHSPVVSDVIAARDIASYPDSNLAESLQRIPGMSITREAGEGRQIMLRGLNPDFTLVTLNGMPVLANNDSPMDSRLQKHRDRSFDLNLFATELFSEIQVLKSYTADQPSGGLAGIAALQTAHPFDTPGLRWSVTQQVGTNQYAGGIAPRLSGMLSSTRGNWGALLSVSYGSRKSQEVGANTFRWRKILPEGADISALPTDIQQAWQDQQIWIPRGNRYSVWHSDMQRLGIGASLEYLTNQSHITFDWLYGEFSGERRENHLYPRGFNSTPIIEGQSRITEAQLNKHNELIYARYQNARVGTESRFQKVATHYQQWVLNTEHQFTGLLSGTGTFGMEQANYEMPLSIKAYMRGSSDITVDYRSDYHFADIAYADDLTAPSFWTMNELDSEKYRAGTTFANARYQLNYAHNTDSAWTMGIDLTHFKNTLDYTDIQDILLPEWTASAASNQVPENASYILNAHPKLNWLALEPRSAFAYFAVPLSPDAIAFSPFIRPDSQVLQHNAIREVRAAGYVQHQWQYKQWQLISGVRAEQDRTRIYLPDTPAQDYELSHMNWLPSLTVNFRQPERVYRLAVSKTIGRPQLETLAQPEGYNADSNTVWLFNPALKPYSAYNLDLAFEYYPKQTNRFSLTLFTKWLDDYIVNRATALPASATASSESGVQVMAVNAEQAWLYGIESSAQFETSLGGLPQALQAYHLGIVTNVSYSRGKVAYYNDVTGGPLSTKQLPFLSPWLANITAYVEGYAFSFRLSATYRDSYIARVDGNTVQDEDETGFEQSLYLDAVLAYQFSDTLEVRMEATNLTNEQEMQYSDSSRRPYNTTVSGRNYYLGLTYRY